MRLIELDYLREITADDAVCRRENMGMSKKFCEHCSPETGCPDPRLCEHFNDASCPIGGVCVQRLDNVIAGELVFMGSRLSVAHIGQRFSKEPMASILADYPYLTERHVWFAAGYATGRDKLWDKEILTWGGK
jgi:uncharacterized protein (DUF433 family)